MSKKWQTKLQGKETNWENCFQIYDKDNYLNIYFIQSKKIIKKFGVYKVFFPL